MVLVVKNLPVNKGHKRHRFNPWVGKTPHGGGHGNRFQYSCLENPIDRGAWLATVHRVLHNGSAIADAQRELNEFSFVLKFNSVE